MTKFWSPNGVKYYNVDHIVSIHQEGYSQSTRMLIISLSDGRTQHISLGEDETLVDAITDIIEGSVYTHE